MNIIFLTLAGMESVEIRGIYPDLMRKFRNEGHNVYIVTQSERRYGKATQLMEVDGVHILRVRTLNITKTHIVEKGVGTMLIERQFENAIQKHLNKVKFDLITYSTPPITFTNVVKYLKKQNPQVISYLQLKDIFPQNAVDIGMMIGMPVQGEWFTVHGWIDRVKYLLYKYFRNKEIELYKASDYIGCMSPANVEFVGKHNPYYPVDHIEVAPNSIELSHTEITESTERDAIRIKYDIPTDRSVYIYGGNLGKPQGIDYLIRCLDDNKSRLDCYFVVIGTGTEYHKLETWYQEEKPQSVKVMKGLPKEDYDKLVSSCDVGLIFLDHRFTIPNFPSRLLSYLENKMPVICCTDVNTDIGKIAQDNGYGYWCESRNPIDFTVLVNKMLSKPERIKEMGEKGYQYLCQNYLVQNTYNKIMSHF